MVLNIKYISLATWSLCLFTIASFLSPEKYFGSAFVGVPFKLSVLTFILHMLGSFKNEKYLFKINTPNVLLLIMFAVSAIFTFNITVDQERSLIIWGDFSKTMFLYILVSNILTTRDEFKLYALTLALLGAYIGYDYSTNPVWNKGRAYYYGSYLMGDPNGVSMVLVYSIPFIVSFLLNSKNIILKLLFGLGVFYCGLGIIEGQSRGAFVGLLAMAGLTVWAVPKGKKLSTLLLLSLCISFFVIRYVPEVYLSRVQEIANPDSDPTGSAQTRFETMLIAGKYIVSHPFSEYGLGNHSYHIAEEYGWAGGAEVGDIFRGGFLAHNIFLQYGADAGLLPMFVYISFIISIFSKLVKYIKQLQFQYAGNDEIVIFTKCTLISIASFMAGVFFLPWSYNIFTFILSGLAVALSNIIANELQPTEETLDFSAR